MARNSLRENRNGIQRILNNLSSYLEQNDWDVIGYNQTNEYNQRILSRYFQSNQQSQVTNLQLLPDNKLIICVGNSKKMWGKAKDLLLNGYRDPFDQILTPEAIQNCLKICKESDCLCEPFMSHSSKPFLLSFQDLAVATHIGIYSEDIKLVIHPRFGPWFALRFALLLDCEMNTSNNFDSTTPSFQLDQLEFAKARTLLGEGYDPRRHILARKSLSIGSRETYDEDQITYHYHLDALATDVI